MKVAAITGEHQCELLEKADPKAKENFAVVKIHVAPMCTEFNQYKSGGVGDSIGHEAAGEVVEVAQPGKVKVGDRVVVMPQYPCGKCYLCLAGDYIHCANNLNPLEICGCEAGTATYAQYCLKQDWLLLPIPDDMSYEHAAMACCGFGPTFGAMQLMQVDAFDTVLITGLGPVGLGGVINAVYRGARVIGVESNPYRAQLAKNLGAEEVIDPNDESAAEQVKDLTDGLGADKGVDTSGFAAAPPFLIETVRRKGHVALVGGSGELNVGTILFSGLTIHGAWHWNLADFPKIMQVIRASGRLIDKQITHTFPMSQVRDAWELQLTGQCGKVILYPWK